MLVLLTSRAAIEDGVLTFVVASATAWTSTANESDAEPAAVAPPRARGHGQRQLQRGTACRLGPCQQLLRVLQLHQNSLAGLEAPQRHAMATR